MILRGQGLRPIRITRLSALHSDLGSLLRGGALAPVSLEALVPFTAQLNVLIGSGVPLVQALEVLGEQTNDRSLNSIILAVKEKVSQGSFLWEALNGYPTSFPRIYIALIRAGEASGSLDIMLKRLSRYLEDADRLKKMMKSAMMYPAFVVGVGVIVVAAMLIFVIPKMEELLASNKQELPAITQIVITLSHFMIDRIGEILIGGGVSFYLLARYSKSKEGRSLIDRLAFKLPLFGPLTQKAGVARFCRTMSTLLSSGVNLLDAIDICRGALDNAVLEDSASRIRKEVEGGKTLGMVVRKMVVFPKMAVQMITVGEQTGNLDSMLERVADFYETEVEATVQGLSKLIEPMILVVLGGAVTGLLVAMYLPIFKMAQSTG